MTGLNPNVGVSSQEISISAISSPILLVGADNVVKYANDSFGRFVNSTQAVGRSLSDLFGNSVDQILSRIQTPSTEPIIRSNGRWYELSVTPYGHDTKLCMFYDVTSHKEREASLYDSMKFADEANRSKSEFLANMSHEIRTPMNGIMGMAEVLSNLDLGERPNDMVRVISSSSSGLLNIINDILDFSKVEAGSMELAPEETNLRDVIEEVYDLVATNANQKNLELILRIDPELPTSFMADRMRLRQIIMNLVGNAIKFTESGHILIDILGNALSDGDGKTYQLNIKVEDTGEGISPEDMGNIFQKFKQAGTATNSIHKGTGLGLPIAKKFAELMGGGIAVDSVLGEGTRFTVTLPLVECEDVDAIELNTEILKGAKLLIVDDNKINCDILTSQMQEAGCKAVTVNSGAMALNFLKQAYERNITLDMILLDYKMQGMTGEETFDKIKALLGDKTPPTILLSSRDNSDLKSRLLGNGIKRYLVKPVRSALLVQTVMEVLSADQSGQDTANPIADAVTPVEHSFDVAEEVTAAPTQDDTISQAPYAAESSILASANILEQALGETKTEATEDKGATGDKDIITEDVLSDILGANSEDDTTLAEADEALERKPDVADDNSQAPNEKITVSNVLSREEMLAEMGFTDASFDHTASETADQETLILTQEVHSNLPDDGLIDEVRLDNQTSDDDIADAKITDAQVEGLIENTLAAIDMPMGELTSSENSEATETSESKVDILVVEDNLANQTVVSYFLKDIGLSYEIADNGQIGLQMYQQLNPRAILMDVSMPVMNGYECTRAIRKLESEIGLHTPIVGTTAHALKRDRDNCFASGMDHYVSKPMSMVKLQQALVDIGVLGTDQEKARA